MLLWVVCVPSRNRFLSGTYVSWDGLLNNYFSTTYNHASSTFACNNWFVSWTCSITSTGRSDSFGVETIKWKLDKLLYFSSLISQLFKFILSLNEILIWISDQNRWSNWILKQLFKSLRNSSEQLICFS